MAVQVLPKDEHNDRLVANVHPPDWVNPEPAPRYNLVVIGAGTAGLVTAAGAAGLGARVALIERELLGGDCLNVGCVPSKALIRAARAAAQVRDAAQFGIRVPPGVQVDFAAVMERMRRLRADISPHDSAARFRSLGVDVYLGQAGFHRARTRLRWPAQTLRFRRAVIATGARAASAAHPGPGRGGLPHQRDRLLAHGTAAAPGRDRRRADRLRAGSGLCPFRLQGPCPGQSSADPAQRGPGRRRAGREGPAAGRRGVHLELPDRPRREAGPRKGRSSQPAARETTARSSSMRSWSAPAGCPTWTVSTSTRSACAMTGGTALPSTTGCKPPTRTSYAAGDVCSRFKFTHAADAMARIVIQNALFQGRARASALTIPWCTYTDPEIAHVGLYEHEARERGIAFRTFTQELADVDRAVLDGEDEGFVKVLVGARRDKILGATIVAAHAGDMISELTLAMVGGLGLRTIARTIHPYPTQAEAIKKVGDAYNRTRLTPTVKWLFEKWLAWTR